MRERAPFMRIRLSVSDVLMLRSIMATHIRSKDKKYPLEEYFFEENMKVKEVEKIFKIICHKLDRLDI